MAEINIERKKRSVWPWILLLAILALLAWAIYELTNDRNDVDVEEVPATGMVIPASPAKTITYYATVC